MARKIVIKKPISSELEQRYRKELNEGQYEAVTHGKGPALIIAGAGSGKTRALTYRVAYLVDNGVPAESIILVTFTKKAAREMVEREERLSGSKIKGIQAGTFHHLANITLHKYAKVVELKNNFSILDEHDRIQLMKIALNRKVSKEDKKEKRYPNGSQLVDLYSRRINWAMKLKDALDYFYPQYSEDLSIIQAIFDEYERLKHQNNTLDYDDLLLYFLAFLQNPASNSYKKKITHVLVDEYQDVNSVQSQIIDFLASEAKSLTVVGDDAQAIYRFRGADFTHMLQFPKKYPDYSKYKLEENYRSTPEILKLANASIRHNKKQFKKTLFTSKESGELPALVSCRDREQEAAAICSEILRYRDEGIPLHEQAVLFRAGFHSSILQLELNRRNIPYEVRAGVRFFEKAHIKDFLSLLILITNPSDIIQWMRLISLHEGLSPVSAQKIIDGFGTNRNQLEQFVNTNYEDELKGKRVMKKGLDHLKNLQQLFQETVFEMDSNSCYKFLPLDKLPPLESLAEKYVHYLEPLIKEQYVNKNPEERIMELREIINLIKPYNNLDAFLADILTQYDLEGQTINAGNDLDEEKPLVLTTIHQAKGLEWKVVFLIALIEGQMPISKSIGDPEEIEEERRLFYVACTRAKDHLILTYPQFFPTYNYGRSDILEGPSRFLTEIRDSEVYEEVEVENEF